MRKLLFLLTTFSLCSMLSVNETSCFCFNRNNASIDDIYNKIDKAENIKAKGSNLNSDASNELTTKVILNDIGLSSSEQTYVTLSGTLNEGATAKVTFTISKKSETKTIEKDVKWLKMSDELDGLNVKSSVWLGNKDCLVGTLDDGIYKSSNDGDSFEQIPDTVFTSTSALSMIIAKDKTIYVGTNGNGLWKSEDDGASFEEVTLPSYGTEAISDIFQDSSGTIWIAGQGDIWNSTNNGDSFEEKKGIGLNDVCLTVGENNDAIYIGSKDEGLWKSENDGASYEQVSSLGIPDDISILAIQTAGNVLYIGTEEGLYISKDKGSSFTQVDDSKIPVAEIVAAMYYDSANKTTYIGSGHDEFYSTSDNDTYNNISYNSDEVGNISDVDSTLFIGGDNNFDGTDTQGLWYYAI